MAVIPDLQALQAAAAAIEKTAGDVEADAGVVDGKLQSIPWKGPRRDRVLGLAGAAVSTGRRQAEAERALARALRQLASTVEHELQVLAELAARARRHLEELLARARTLVARAAQEVANATALARSVITAVVDVVTADAAGALRAARSMVARAEELMQTITVRLNGLPDVHDPVWRQLGQEILRWQPV